MSNDELSLQTILIAIDTIMKYSSSARTADEIWDIIQNHLPVLKQNIRSFI